MTRRIGVAGLGLIGGSFALAMKRRGARVCGVSRSAETLALAKQLGAIDDDREEALGECDIVFIAVPVQAAGGVFARLSRFVSAKTVAMDGGSVKSGLANLARKHFGENAGRFVPCHPVAGAEKSGVAAARADLFEGAEVVLCPAESDDDAAQTAREVWRETGAKVSEMDANEHDQIFAMVSHLPHLLSYALVNQIDEQSPRARDLMLRHAAGGFRDFTRIAGSHPEMWRDIFLDNKTNLLAAISGYRAALNALEEAARKGDGAALFEKFEAARKLRNAWVASREKAER